MDRIFWRIEFCSTSSLLFSTMSDARSLFDAAAADFSPPKKDEDLGLLTSSRSMSPDRSMAIEAVTAEVMAPSIISPRFMAQTSFLNWEAGRSGGDELGERQAKRGAFAKKLVSK